MSKYGDRKKAGRSDLVPFVPDEEPADRHRRRLSTNLDYEAAVRDWCEATGWALTIKNDGHHWMFRRKGLTADWWPSSAKLVINQRWDRGIHCHDYKQVIERLRRLGEQRA